METAAQSEHLVHFRSFELNLQTRNLYRRGLKLRLHGHPIEVLAMLLERPGELVTREALRKALWPEDTFVDFEHGLNTTINRLRETLGDKADAPQYVETIPRLGYRFIAPIESRPQILLKPASKIESLAVLPLDNLSGDSSQEYFADGMTDALLTDLGKIHALRVISRQSIMQYKGSRKTLPEIARELNVDVIVEGTVQRSGNKVRITAQLIHGKADHHLWTESYERDFREVLSLQSEVARDIAKKIEVTISPEESCHFSAARTVNPEAYEAYLKGRFEWYRISSQSFASSERYYQLALEKDPNCALAYSGLADVWLLRVDSGYKPPSEAMPKAIAAANKALQLDSNLSETHLAMANIDALYERDWASAEKEFLLAIELNPNNHDAHFGYADYLISLKRNQEWQSEIQRALALDPMSPLVRTFYGWHLVYLGHFDEAIEELQKGLTSQPDFSSAHMGLWGAYYKKHMDAHAMEEAVRFFQTIHDQEAAEALEVGYKQAGYKQGMNRAADLLAHRAQSAYVPGIRIARLYAHAGDTNQSILWLNKADEARETTLLHLGVAWDWDSLRSDPRFQALLMRMDFPAVRD